MRTNGKPEQDQFVGALANTLADSVLHLQQAVDRVTNLVMADQKPSREMIVAFQAFDRLKQEFEGLSNALRHYAAAGPAEAGVVETAIASITVSDLRERLASSLKESSEPFPGEASWEDEKTF